MALETLTLTLNPGAADAREYTITMLESIDVSSRKDAFSIAPPGLASHRNILLGVSGMQADIDVSFRAHDDGTDKSNGTAPADPVRIGTDADGNSVTYDFNGSVVSVEDQLLYLEHIIHDEAFTSEWELDHDTGAAFNDAAVFVETVDISPIDRQSPLWKPVTLRLRRGRSVG
jgi:hypothetical protein